MGASSVFIYIDYERVHHNGIRLLFESQSLRKRRSAALVFTKFLTEHFLHSLITNFAIVLEIVVDCSLYVRIEEKPYNFKISGRFDDWEADLVSAASINFIHIPPIA